MTITSKSIAVYLLAAISLISITINLFLVNRIHRGDKQKDSQIETMKSRLVDFSDQVSFYVFENNRNTYDELKLLPNESLHSDKFEKNEIIIHDDLFHPHCYGVKYIFNEAGNLSRVEEYPPLISIRKPKERSNEILDLEKICGDG